MQNVSTTTDLKIILRESLLKAGFREFTKSDWSAFLDAERFDGVIEPIIKDEDEMAVIFDNSGFHSYYDHPMDMVYTTLLFNEQ